LAGLLEETVEWCALEWLHEHAIWAVALSIELLTVVECGD